MSDFYNKIRNAYENEYTNAYAMKNRGLYSIPKIYDANGDLSKRWYVYFSFRNPKTGKMERQTPVYLGVNKLKKLSERREAIKVLRDALEKALANGTINPYENTYSEIKIINIAQAVELALKNAQATMRESSFKDYKSNFRICDKTSFKNIFSIRQISKIKFSTERTHPNVKNQIKNNAFLSLNNF
ncbi:hypothetical protein [Capnocytophaga canimorsus]|uniref:hypothetical protein n=1 Tax=Capnocytophaga canimorsus TaxID=28188 RepID=UPI00249AFA4B|nr:hypothetical protein [Capnocytophaga canimorsus]WGU67967.1 hypothetical protein QIU19_11270 [Capnocytophaga canimorsus]WGU70933.1 hypothetical protein QIU18_02555 [Capnocytophaga canimorsus]